MSPIFTNHTTERLMAHVEIQKTFPKTYRDMMRARSRRFARRSVYRYAIGIALVTFAIHGSDPTLGLSDKLLRAGIYFAILCAMVWALLSLTSYFQARSSKPRTVTFREDGIVEVYDSETIEHEWNWIAIAEETPHLLCMVVTSPARLEMFLPKASLAPEELAALCRWLRANGKLS